MLTQVVVGLTTGSAYALMAVAVVLVFSGTRTLSIAMGEIGAFAFYVGLRGIPQLGLEWSVSPFVSGVIAVLGGGALGLLVERLVMRQLVRRPPLDGLIATLGVALFLALLEVELYGVSPLPAPSPVGRGVVRVGDAVLVAPRIAGVVVTALVAAALYVFFTKTSFGLATRATVSDPTVARLLGVKVNRVYVLVWGVGGMLSGAAACLLAPAFGNLTAFSQTTFSLRALAGAVIGGLDSVWGAIAGCLLVGVVEAVVNGQVGTAGVGDLAVLVLVLGTLLVRPRGLMGATGAA